jgi:hypothetical protein
LKYTQLTHALVSWFDSISQELQCVGNSQWEESGVRHGRRPIFSLNFKGLYVLVIHIHMDVTRDWQRLKTWGFGPGKCHYVQKTNKSPIKCLSGVFKGEKTDGDLC